MRNRWIVGLTSTFISLILFTFAFLSAACIFTGNATTGSNLSDAPNVTPLPSPIKDDDKEVAAHRETWLRNGSKDYDMLIALDMSSFIEPARAVHVEVRGGEIASVTVPDKRDKRGNLYFYAPYETVERIFDTIVELRQKKRSEVIVKYNEKLGYPEEIRYFEPLPDSSFTFHVVKLDLK